MRGAAHRPVSVLLAAAVLVGSCGSPDVTPSPAPPATAGAVPTPSDGAAAPSATMGPGPSPTATATPPDPFLGQVVVTVSDNLRVRSQPRVSDDSVRYEPLLPLGTELRVVGGPVSGSGYVWYRVAPLSLALRGGPGDGWVAMAGKDGEAWIALAEGPPAGIELARSSAARAPADPAAARAAAASVNAFGLDLLRAMLADPKLGLADKNAVFSPASIALALAMARAGARGETASQMDAVLHASGWEELATGLNALDQALAQRNATWQDPHDTGGATRDLALRIANSAFAQRGWSIEQAYLERIASTFGAGVRLVDYAADVEAARNLINAWVSGQTKQRIPELIAKDRLSDLTRLVLVNAIYLKAAWAGFHSDVLFPEEATSQRPFTRLDGSRVTVLTMRSPGGWAWKGGSGLAMLPYARGNGWQATELRYVGADGSLPLAMTLILPDDLAAFERHLTSSQLARIVATLEAQREALFQTKPHTWPGGMTCEDYPYSLELFLPRFGIDTRADLASLLATLGMPAAFDTSTADFAGITTEERLFIANVIHQATIDVDEKGTEASAATALSGDTTGGCGDPSPVKTITLRLDRPFLFVLRDVETGAALFMGRVVDPSVGR